MSAGRRDETLKHELSKAIAAVWLLEPLHIGALAPGLEGDDDAHTHVHDLKTNLVNARGWLMNVGLEALADALQEIRETVAPTTSGSVGGAR